MLQAATDFIQQSDVDAAILFCDRLLEPFYAEKAWVATRSPTHLY
jgi:hypothetical protein